MNRGAILVIGIVLVIAMVFGFLNKGSTGRTTAGDNTQVKIETTKGDIIVELYPDEAPKTVENFLSYTESSFYSGTIFHRVIKGFMIQGGGFDTNGVQKTTSAPIELESDNGLKNQAGRIAMARTTDPNSATSQFFINTIDNDFLNYGVRDQGYAVFGKVLEGMEVVHDIENTETDPANKPLENVEIIKVSVL